MSAFICNDETINRILGFCYWNHQPFLESEIKKILNKNGFSVEDETKQQELGNAIRELNYRSIRARYGKEAEQNDRGVLGEFKFKEVAKEKRTIEQVYNHLRCLTYQCCEGECDKDPLYLMLEELEKALAFHIANREVDKVGCEWEAK